MFTGLVQGTGTVAESRTAAWTVEGASALDLVEGGSVAVNGVCLTATAVRGRAFGRT